MFPDEVVAAVQAVRDDFAARQLSHKEAVISAQALVDANEPVVIGYQKALDSLDALLASLGDVTPTSSTRN